MVKAVLPDVGGTGSFPGGGTKIPPDMPSTCPPPKKKTGRYWEGFWQPWGFPTGSDGNASTCNAGDPGLTPGSGRSWRREWQPTSVFLPGESHGQRSQAGYSPWGHKSQTQLSASLSLLQL